ncbi:MAG: hypothetical protein AABP62_22175 [Planctomycetota bacterium]
MKHRLAILLCFLSVLGCGGKGSAKRDPVYPVSGKITYKGAPVVGADVTFASDGGKRSAFGRTDDKGAFRLTTFAANDGAVEGKHTVTIVKTTVAAPTVKQAPIESKDYIPPPIEDTSNLPVVLPKSEFPTKYASATTSGLIAVVNKDGANEITLDLTD